MARVDTGGRREAILAAAAALLAERPHAGAVGVDEIAARAGVAKATLYRYFPSKAAVVQAVAAQGGHDAAGWEAPDRRLAILDAAQRLIPQQGVRATTMEQIAEAAGVSPAALYWHFDGKEALLIAMAERVSPLAEVRRALARGADGDPAEDLRALARLMLDVLAERFQVMQACLGEAAANPRLAQHVLQRVALPIWGTLGAYFEAQVAAGRLRPAPALPRVFTFASLAFAFTLARRILGAGLPVDAEQLVDTHVDTFLNGVATASYREALSRDGAQGTPAPPAGA